MELVPGTILAGKYRCERELGAGGMGRVIAATHLVLRQLVAVKVLTRTRSPDAARRFLREARLASRLSSPHVPKMLDAGQLEDGVPYIAMELLEGVDLASVVDARGALPVAEACDYVLQACAGVGEAHALGIIHRDIKLANLFLARTAQGPIVKVLDFGCAKAERTGATSVAYPTNDGAWLGTPRSMAPEQLVSSRDVDARADVWSLGVALYTLVAGRPPFDGKTLRIVYHQIQHEPPPPIARPIPSGLAAIIERCLYKDPSKRFADARVLGAALAPFVNARPARSARTLAFVAVAIAIAFMAVVAAAIVIVIAITSRAPVVPASPALSASSVVESASPVTTSTPNESAPTTTSSVATTAPEIVRPAPPTTTRGATLVTLARDVASFPDYPTNAQARALATRFCDQTRAGECLQVSREGCISDVATHISSCFGYSDRLGCLEIPFRGRANSKSKACTDL